MACPRPSPVTCGGIRFQAAQRERAAIKPPSEPALSPCPQRPLEERRDELSQLVHGVDNILFSEALSAEGALVFAKTCVQAADIGAGTAGKGRARGSSAREQTQVACRRVPGTSSALKASAVVEPGAITVTDLWRGWGRHRPARSGSLPCRHANVERTSLVHAARGIRI